MNNRRECAKCHQWYKGQGSSVVGACVSGEGYPSAQNPEHDWKEVAPSAPLLGKEEKCAPVSWPEYITEEQKARARRLVAPQPPPKSSDGVAVWPLIVDSLIGVSPLVEADMIARDEYGRGKYKVPLVAGNGRDNLVDWYQEELDGLAYARAEIQNGDPTGIAVRKFEAKLRDVVAIRAAIERRDRE